MKTQDQSRALPVAAHTPTPWMFMASDPGFSRSRVYTYTTEDYVTIARDIDDINAAFIVRACNSHAALVEALETTDALFTSLSSHNFSDGARILLCAKIVANRAALALAKEGTP